MEEIAGGQRGDYRETDYKPDGKEYTIRVTAGTEVDEKKFVQTIRENIKIAEERAKRQNK